MDRNLEATKRAIRRVYEDHQQACFGRRGKLDSEGNPVDVPYTKAQRAAALKRLTEVADLANELLAQAQEV
jgi:hypothetical protein